MEINIIISLLIGILVSLVVYMVKIKKKEEKAIGFYAAITITVSILSFFIMNNTMCQNENSHREMITGEPKF